MGLQTGVCARLPLHLSCAEINVLRMLSCRQQHAAHRASCDMMCAPRGHLLIPRHWRFQVAKVLTRG